MIKKYAVRNTFFAVLFGLSLFLSYGAKADEHAKENALFLEALKAMKIEDAAEAYAAYIELFLVVSPHPDHKIAYFIAQAQAGDVDSFAFFSFSVWRGYGGIIENKLAGKFGLSRAHRDGSADASFYISQTFLQGPAENDEEKLDNLLAALQWLGVSAAMGSEESHDFAMKYIRKTAKGNAEVSKMLTVYYNRGLARGPKSKSVRER